LHCIALQCSDLACNSVDRSSDFSVTSLELSQWWANHKSNHKDKAQIICKNDLNQNLKSKIKESNPIQIIFGPNQITNQFYRYVKFLKMFSLSNLAKITTVLHTPIIVSSR